MDRADKMELLHAALQAYDATKFARLLAQYPDCRYDGAGDDCWMRTACTDGKLWAVELLVDQGANINKPTNSTDSDPHPEGPIVQAAGSGNVELVRYLLDRGASVNYTIAGQVRCFALTRAAWKGPLNVVRLLVERGAEINAAWANKTALDHALQWGRDDIAAYVRSVGGKTASELSV